LERHDGFLVSVIAHPFDKHREAFGDPGSVCSVVPGWREALVMYDADGLATPLIEEVRAWIWGPLERRCDRWVAEETTGYAEEVHKLAPALRNGNRPLAAVQRSLLAVHLAPVVARSTAASSMAPRTTCGIWCPARWGGEARTAIRRLGPGR
jgi:hypothetical protein